MDVLKGTVLNLSGFSLFYFFNTHTLLSVSFGSLASLVNYDETMNMMQWNSFTLKVLFSHKLLTSN